MTCILNVTKGGFRVGNPGPPPLLLTISALHAQYGIQAFPKFNGPECTRLLLTQGISISKIFLEEHVPETPEKGELFAVLMGTIAPIL